MNHVKTNEEYRYFKGTNQYLGSPIGSVLDPTKKNVKDPNEPFFIKNKWDYKTKKDTTEMLAPVGIDYDEFIEAKKILSDIHLNPSDIIVNRTNDPDLNSYTWCVDGYRIMVCFRKRGYDEIRYLPPYMEVGRKNLGKNMVMDDRKEIMKHQKIEKFPHRENIEPAGDPLGNPKAMNRHDFESVIKFLLKLKQQKDAYREDKVGGIKGGYKTDKIRYSTDSSVFDSLNHVQSFQMFEEIDLGASRLSRRRLDYDLVLEPEKKEKIINYLMNLEDQPFRSEQVLRDSPDWQLKEWWYDYKPFNPKRSLYNFVSSVEADFRKLDTGWEDMGGSYHTNNKLDYDRRLSTKVKKGINKMAGKPILNVKK